MRRFAWDDEIAGEGGPSEEGRKECGREGGRDMRLRRWIVILDPALNLILTQFKGFTKL